MKKILTPHMDLSVKGKTNITISLKYLTKIFFRELTVKQARGTDSDKVLFSHTTHASLNRETMSYLLLQALCEGNGNRHNHNNQCKKELISKCHGMIQPKYT